MGIRIHRRLGYALTDVRTDGFKVSDERINSGSWLLTHDFGPSMDAYREWLESNATDHRFSVDLAALKHGDVKARGLDSCITHDAEYGLPEVLLLQPLSMLGEWSRYDDSIDYAQETYLRGDEAQQNRVEPITHCVAAGLYPWSGTYMDDRTGERLGDMVMHWIRVTNSLKGDPGTEMDLLARAAGFADHADALAHCAPLVPEEIRDLATFAGLFTDDTVWRQLRPVLYTYWS